MWRKISSLLVIRSAWCDNASEEKREMRVMTKDMTVGNPLRLILSFSIPLIFGNIFQQLYNMADSIIVGRVIGLNALTAVGASSAIIFLIVGFTIGTCSGLGIPIALQFGAKDYKRMRMFVYNSAYLAVVLAIIITAVTSFLCDDLLRMMKTPQEIFDDAYKYMLVICLGIPFTFLYNTCSAIIRAINECGCSYIIPHIWRLCWRLL